MSNKEWPETSGWHKLVNPLIRFVEKSGGTILQTKEKFGEFRLYWDAHDMDSDLHFVIDRAIDAVTAQSRKTCIVCGDGCDVRMLNDRWILPLCKTHAEEQGRDWENGEEMPGWKTSAYKITNIDTKV